MKLFHSIAEVRAFRRTLSNAPIPFVPTMGALHAGHISLVRDAAKIAGHQGTILASIFVNPTQFGPAEDFAKYPRTLEEDLRQLEAAGCKGVFLPTPAEMYPDQATTSTKALASTISVDPGHVGTILEGALRPDHFRGVCTVVAKLLNIVQPTHLLLGQKDFQQQLILRSMCRSLDMSTKVVTCATVRESDGLAMSSRNRYLSSEERFRATAISRALSRAADMFRQGERDAFVLETFMIAHMTEANLKVDYALAAHPETLISWTAHTADPATAVPIKPGTITGPCVFITAARNGTTRLLDNLLP